MTRHHPLASVAQLVEQSAFNRLVTGSSPVGGIPLGSRLRDRIVADIWRRKAGVRERDTDVGGSIRAVNEKPLAPPADIKLRKRINETMDKNISREWNTEGVLHSEQSTSMF